MGKGTRVTTKREARAELNAAFEAYRKAHDRVTAATKGSVSQARALMVLPRADLERRGDRASRAVLACREARRTLHLAAEQAALA